jgi:DHA1 family tetracycline resistance protein-like MFS transporter
MAVHDRRVPGRAAVAFIFVTVMLDMLALGIMVPILPRLVVEFEGGNTASAAMIFGVFAAAWAAMQFLFSPLLGVLSDRVGRRPVVLLSNLGLGLDYVLMALAPSLWWLFLGRVISGITAASFATAGAYIADVTPPAERAAKFGLLGAAFGLGFVIGPALGGVLGEIDLRLPFRVAAGLSLVNAAYGFFILPESLPPDRRAPFNWKRANPLGSLDLLRSHPELFGLAGAAFLSRVAHDSLSSIFVLYGDYRYRWDESTTGFILAGVGVTTMIVQAGLVRPIVAWLGDRHALFAGFIAGAIGFAAFALAPTSLLFLIGIVFLALYGIASPALQSLMTQRVSETEQGQLQGAYGSIGGITGMMAPFMFTQVFAFSIDADRTVQLPGPRSCWPPWRSLEQPSSPGR